jgi:CRP-like cAMP-binding protein
MADSSNARYARNLTRHRGWFGRAPKAFQDAVLALCSWCPFEADEAIYWAADDSADLACTAEGTVAIYSRFGTGDNPLIHLAQPGFWFGAASFISGEARRVSAIARTDAVIGRVPARAMGQLLEKRPDWWRHVGMCALEYADLAVTGAVDAMIPEHDRRCAATLLRLAGLRPALLTPSALTDIPVTQDELAATLRVSRSTVIQVLRRLNSAGLLELHYGSIRLLNLGALDALAHDKASDGS